jgi:hypothetical protein
MLSDTLWILFSTTKTGLVVIPAAVFVVVVVMVVDKCVVS